MWVNLTGGEGPKTQKESLYYRGKSAYVGAGIQRIPGQRVGCADVTVVVGPRNSPSVLVGSSGFRGLGSPPEPQHHLPMVIVITLYHNAISSTPRAVNQLNYNTQGYCSYRATRLYF